MGDSKRYQGGMSNSAASFASTRFYRSKYPELEEVVMVTVLNIAEIGAYVRLKEYGEIEGMILLSELSRRRIRSIQKLIRVGRDEVATVLRVDKEKGYIDLSKRRVSPEDVAKCEEKYTKSRAVQTIMRNIAESHKMTLLDLHERITWPLYDKYGHAFDAFKLALNDPEGVFEGLNADAAILQDLLQIIRRRMTPAPVKVRADIEITCFEYEGINAIRRAIEVGEAHCHPNTNVKVRLVAPPLYIATATTTEKSGGVPYLEEVIARIGEQIAKEGGTLNVKVKPRIVSATDEKELEALMERVEKENAEVDGDEEDGESVSASSGEEDGEDGDESSDNDDGDEAAAAAGNDSGSVAADTA